MYLGVRRADSVPLAGLKTATKQKRGESGAKPYVAPPSIDLTVSLSLSPLSLFLSPVSKRVSVREIIPIDRQF